MSQARPGQTVLMALAQKHDWPRAAEALIEKGCDVLAQDSAGNTALDFAKEKKHRKTAKVLAEAEEEAEFEEAKEMTNKKMAAMGLFGMQI